ncbi:MAG: alpha/beta fold hydrolase [Anaerovoracaceae bacterium]
MAFKNGKIDNRSDDERKAERQKRAEAYSKVLRKKMGTPKKILLVALALVLILAANWFLGLAGNPYLSDTASNKSLEESKYSHYGNFLIMEPQTANGTVFVFYPGARVEYTAYSPQLLKLTKKGVTVIVAQMPYNYAIFGSNNAGKVLKTWDKFSDLKIKKFYVGGHSLGGAMASKWASKNPDKVDGVILLGAYKYGSIDVNKVLTIYGSYDEILNKNKIDYSENVNEIDGGNHAYFGNYGEQNKDGKATISRKKQQEIAANLILNFMNQ